MSRLIDPLAQTRVNMFDSFYELADPDEKATLDILKSRVCQLRNMGETSAKELIMALLTNPVMDRIRKDY